MMIKLDVAAKRGTVLNEVLFRQNENRTADTVMIAMTGIHGNFYPNPFYYNIGDTLNRGGIDFIYAQTNDAFGEIQTINAHMPTARENALIFIEKTGHTYQMKHQEVADRILAQLQDWRDKYAVHHCAR